MKLTKERFIEAKGMACEVVLFSFLFFIFISFILDVNHLSQLKVKIETASLSDTLRLKIQGCF